MYKCTKHVLNTDYVGSSAPGLRVEGGENMALDLEEPLANRLCKTITEQFPQLYFFSSFFFFLEKLYFSIKYSIKS